MEDLVKVQDGSVVSRTVIDRPEGTVTAFAFDGGQALSEHSAPYDALVQMIQGAMEIKVGGVPHSVKAGEWLMMPADVPHSVEAMEPSIMVLTMVRG
jgi:quercetin dioxygenase-like cupin family protein